MVERDGVAVAAAQQRVLASLERPTRRGKLQRREAEAAVDRIQFATDLNAIAACDLVIEAVMEDRAVKVEVFRALADVVQREDTLLASNTSSIPIVELAMAAGNRAANVLGLHFFNPVPVMSLVEIVASLFDGRGCGRARKGIR